MALSLTSRFQSLQLSFDPVYQAIVDINYVLSDGTRGNVHYIDGVVFIEDIDKLDLLSLIYAGAGFLDPLGLLIDVDISPPGIRFSVIEDISLPYRNPFLAEIGEQSSIQIGINSHNLRLWRQSADRPNTSPTVNWWDIDTNQVVPQLLGWYHKRSDALAAYTGTSTDPVWFALDIVAINDAGVAIYNGWEWFQEFGVEFSADRTNWHSVEADDDVWMGFLTPDGSRVEVRIAMPVDLTWTELYQGTPYSVSGAAVYNAFGETHNLNLYRRLRFTWRPFGQWASGGGIENVGGEVFADVDQPVGGWRATTGNNNVDSNFSTYTWWFEDVIGAGVILHGDGSYSTSDLPSAISRPDENNQSQPPRRLAGKLKLIAGDVLALNLVSGIRLYDFVANSNYERFELIIEGATY